MSKRLYFIAIMPPKTIIDEITTFKQYAADHFNSRRAFRSPAHITLQPPFNWEEDKVDEVKKALSDFSKNRKKFNVAFKNFNCFPPKVIYVDVIKTQALDDLRLELINDLFEKLKIKKDRYPTYHPHSTIAFRDLKEEVFAEAWNYFSKQTYEASFEVGRIALLEHRGEIGWEIGSYFEF